MTSKELRELCEKRGKLIADARAILDTAERDDKRELTSEEQEQWDKLYDEAGKLKSTIDNEERQQALDRDAAESRGRQSEAEKPGDGDPDAETRQSEKPSEFRYKLPNGRGRVLPISGGVRSSEAYERAFDHYMLTGEVDRSTTDEVRALQADSLTAGGALVPPEQFVNRLIKFIDDLVFVRQLATVTAVPNADSLGAPSLDTDIADSDWTSELLTGTADSSMAFGKRDLHPWPLAKSIRVSNKLLRLGVISAESLVRDRMAYKIAVTQEKAFITGNGANQPLGVMTASAGGISTARDVSTGNTTTTIGADNLFEVKYSIKAPYRQRPSFQWMFHRDGVKQVAKLKDANGQYLWRPGIAGGQPDTLLNIPLMESEFMSNTFTTGLYVGILGDWSLYWIADSLGMTIQRLVELYAATNQVGFISRSETDGMPVLEEGWARVTLA